MTGSVLQQRDITEIENWHNVVYRGYVADSNDEYRDREHTNVEWRWLTGWLYADGTLVIPFINGCEVFDPVATAFTAASPEALDDLLRGGNTASEK